MKKSKLRNTLAKEIKKAAQSEDVIQTFRAQVLATFGRPLTATEDLVRMYYATRTELNTQMDGSRNWHHKVIIRRQGEKEISTDVAKITELAFKNIKTSLFDKLMSAIDGEDSHKIQELADAVRFFKGRKRPHPIPIDVEREMLLSLKVELGGEKITIRELAEFMAKKKKKLGLAATPENDTPADGFSALRRKCREINSPLAPSRKISAK